MAKMSKIAKDIANQPKLKKELATYIAKNTKIPDHMTLLLEGHRGYLAMTDEELSKRFDQMYEAANKRIEELNSKIGEVHTNWQRSQIETEISILKGKVKEADDLYDALFEHLFL